MIRDGREVADGARLEAGVCVIGGGAAGITLARELARAPIDVLLLESGGFEYSLQTEALYAGELTGLDLFSISSSRLHYLGGTTNHWGGQTMPLDELDFEPRPWVPTGGWPIRKSDLDPFYPSAQEICDLGPESYDPEYWRRRVGGSLFRLDPDRFKNVVYRFSDPPTRFGKKYRKELESSDRIRCYLNSTVTEIVADENGRTVNHLEVACLEGPRFRVRAKTYVMACGAIETARLLLLSDRHAQRGLGNEHDQVGRYFMDHLGYDSGAIRLAGPAKARPLYDVTEAGDRLVRAGLALSPKAQRQEKVLNMSMLLTGHEGSLEAVEALKRILGALRHGRLPDHLGRDVAEVLRNWDSLAGKAYHHFFPPESDEESGAPDYYRVRNRLEQAPDPESRVTLAADRDALGCRRPHLNWKVSGLETRTLSRAHELLGAQLGKHGLGRLQIADKLEDGAWLQDAEPQYHHMGTTRMSDDPKQGVVDRNCRVHGIGNLYVAGSSTFATSGQAHPTLTIVALALRLAQHLATERA